MNAAARTFARRRVAGRVGLYVLVLLFAAQAAIPFAWSLITTFKANPDLYTRDNNPFLFNDPPTLEHLRLLFRGTAFTTFVGNTLVVALCVVAITLVVSVPAAYSLGRMNLLSQGVGEGWLAEDSKERLEISIPYETFLQLARASYVEFSVGKTTFALRDKNIAALRDMNNRVKLPQAPAQTGGGN